MKSIRAFVLILLAIITTGGGAAVNAASVCTVTNTMVGCVGNSTPVGVVTSGLWLTTGNVGPTPMLTVTAPNNATVQSGAALPTLVFGVSRQSAVPSSPLACTVQGANPLNYACAPSGDIVTQTSASCVCTASPSTAPTVTTVQSYGLTLLASADSQTVPATGTTTVSVEPSTSSGGNRGCTDDVSVPVIREIDFATTPSFPKELYPFTTIGDGVSNPPAVAAIRLRVVEGGGLWLDGSMQIGPGLGTSTAEAVISRCRGRFDAGGRVQVIRLEGYTGPGNQSATTFFPAWWVDPVSQPDAFTARLNAPGRIAADGWASDGIYYVNMRQTWCSAGYGGTCHREISGTGAIVPH